MCWSRSGWSRSAPPSPGMLAPRRPSVLYQELTLDPALLSSHSPAKQCSLFVLGVIFTFGGVGIISSGKEKVSLLSGVEESNGKGGIELLDVEPAGCGVAGQPHAKSGHTGDMEVERLGRSLSLNGAQPDQSGAKGRRASGSADGMSSRRSSDGGRDRRSSSGTIGPLSSYLAALPPQCSISASQCAMATPGLTLGGSQANGEATSEGTQAAGRVQNDDSRVESAGANPANAGSMHVVAEEGEARSTPSTPVGSDSSWVEVPQLNTSTSGERDAESVY